MTTVRQIQLAHSAGDPDSALARRVDLVAAAMKVLVAWEDRKGKNDFAWNADVDDAVSEMVSKARRYRSALKTRRKGI